MTTTLPARRTMTVEEFEAYALLPENADRRLEWHDGEVIELVSSDKSSHLAVVLLSALVPFITARRLGIVTGADGGYIVNGLRLIPDGAFVLADRHRAAQRTGGFLSIAPDLAIEVISPSDAFSHIRAKLRRYERAGTIVWLIDPSAYTLEVFVPGQPAQVLEEGDTLDGGDLLPGFSLTVRDLFQPWRDIVGDTSEDVQ